MYGSYNSRFQAQKEASRRISASVQIAVAHPGVILGALSFNEDILMKELVMKYLGKSDAHFIFSREEDDEVIRFHHVRSDLIYEYQLLTDKFKNQRFRVKFFISELEDRTSRIISDLSFEG